MKKFSIELTERQLKLLNDLLSDYRTDLHKICESDISNYMEGDYESSFALNRPLINRCSFTISEIDYILSYLFAVSSMCSDDPESDKNEVEE